MIQSLYLHVPVQFVEELGKLQDRVPAFSADKAAAIIQADLGQPVSTLFRSFDAQPIAAASLGQVRQCSKPGACMRRIAWSLAAAQGEWLLHICVARDRWGVHLHRVAVQQPSGRTFSGSAYDPDTGAVLCCAVQVHRAVLHSGEAVVIKVQRPGLKQLFDIDLNNLRILAEQLDKGDENRDFKVGLSVRGRVSWLRWRDLQTSRYGLGQGIRWGGIWESWCMIVSASASSLPVSWSVSFLMPVSSTECAVRRCSH